MCQTKEDKDFKNVTTHLTNQICGESGPILPAGYFCQKKGHVTSTILICKWKLVNYDLYECLFLSVRIYGTINAHLNFI